MKHLLLSLLLLYFQPCHPCPFKQILKITPQKITPLYYPHVDIFKTFTSFLNETKPGDKLTIATTYFTNKKIADCLCESAEKGVNISVIIDQASWNNTQTSSLSNQITTQLEESNITTHIFDGDAFVKPNGYPCQMHLKSITWQHNTSTEQLFRIFSGSANLSGAAKKNKELMMFHPNNQKLFNQYEKIFEHLKENQVPSLSQNQNSSTDSITLHTSIIETILLLINHKDFPINIKLSSFTYNSKPLTQAFLKTLSRGTEIQLIVDATTLYNKSSKKQLKQLSQAGAHIFIWNSNNCKHHAKYFLIKREDDCDVAEGSANFTSNADKDVNQITVHNNNKRLYKALEKIFKYAASESSSFF